MFKKYNYKWSLVALLLSLGGCNILPKESVDIEPLLLEPRAHLLPEELTVDEAKAHQKDGDLVAVTPIFEHQRPGITLAFDEKVKYVKKDRAYNHLSYAGGDFSLWTERTHALTGRLEYWLIEQTKKRVQLDYAQGKEAEFMPFLTGNKRGLGTVFPLIDMDEESIDNFLFYVKHTLELDDEKIKMLLHTCFPIFAQHVAKIGHYWEYDGGESSHCDDFIEIYAPDFHGVKKDTPSKTKIVSTVKLDDPKFSAGLYAHLLGYDDIKGLHDPKRSDVIVHLAKTDIFKPTWDAKRLMDPSNQPELKTFAVAAGYTMFGDVGIAKQMRSYTTLRFVGNSGLQHMEKLDWFDVCNQKLGKKHMDMTVAYEHFIHKRYQCQSFDIITGFRGARYSGWGGFQIEADFWVLENWKYNQYRDNVTHRTPGAYALIRLQDGWQDTNIVNKEVRTKEQIANSIMRKSPAHYFVSWMDKRDNKIIGHVLHYGVHYQYDVTDLIEFLNVSRTRSFASTRAD